MLRCGLDPVRVQWLPLATTTSEHLEQYRHIDIALDPIPNGGCTTTCEALWMGAPVITLEGSTYVSRMSTAVLRGAGLGDWVCGSEADYVRLAAAQACNLAQLRCNRDQWRRKLVTSPLGDAADLMRSYAVPEPAANVPPVLVRINCQLAMHYLAERAGMLADSDSAAYNATLKLLAKHASGEVALVPQVAPAPGELPSEDVARITSAPSRYGAGAADDQEWM